MKKTLTKQQKEQIKVWIQEAKEVMHLQDSSIILEYKAKSEDDNCFAEIVTDNRYGSGFLTVFEKDSVELWEEMGDEAVKQTIFHEIAHILVCDLSTLSEKRFCSKAELDKAHEILTEKLSHIFIDLVENK